MNEEIHSGPDEEDLEEEEIEEKESSGSERAPQRHKILTEVERIQIRERYELGETRMVDLAKEYGITRQALSKWFKKEGITYASRAHEVREVVSAGIKGASQRVAERFAEQRESWIEETRVTGYKDITSAIMIAKKIMAETLKTSTPLANADANFKAAQRYLRIVREGAEAKMKILDADNAVNEEDLPKLIVDDLTAEKIREFHEDNGVDDPDELDEILKSFDKDVEA